MLREDCGTYSLYGHTTAEQSTDVEATLSSRLYFQSHAFPLLRSDLAYITTS